MIKSIILKEYCKLKYYFLTLIFVSVVLFALFFYNLYCEFKEIEPESMMWYRYIYLNFKPEEMVKFLPGIFGIIIAFAQFLPESINSRVRNLLHLPISSSMILILHFGFLLALFLLFFIIFGAVFYCLNSFFYPTPILINIVINFFKYAFGGMLLYLCVSISILDKNIKISILKFIISVILYYLFLQLHYVFVVFLILFCVLAIDSLKSYKQQRMCFSKSIYLVLCIAILFGIYKIVDNSRVDFQRYYIFFSPIEKKFVYQKNHGGHNFSYHDSAGNTFSKKHYESLLPFNYWSNLKQQNKLPIVIDSKIYDEKTIKTNRLSISYTYKLLKQNHGNLYPLFNPNKDVAAINYSDDMIWVKNDSFVVFHHNANINRDLTLELNNLSDKFGIKFPIKNVWGKFSNLKPFDAGLFIKDFNGNIFNIKRYNDILSISKIKNIPDDIEYIHISENSQNQILGLAFSKSSVFIFKTNFTFEKVSIDKFDYKSMNLRLSRDPLGFQIRFNDGNKEFAYAYDLNMREIAKFEIE